ncbi:uncharacterized protein PAC_12423 [Phialocephala subalpina]|uniref:FAD-binding domain-containing protein n=1 Tax=Phialocephala subalpina TaxID=576137 RepID=A0A1L7XBZ7_9HELO|nr:uncharacterized protein PAC_12423 [Phialocephala subalpina]
MAASNKKIKVAICGSGIAGLSLLFGLLKHPHLEPILYEVGLEIAGDEGVGVGLAPNALRALKLIDPELREAVTRAGAGQGPNAGTEVVQVGDLKGDVGYLFQRSKFIEQLFKLVPQETCRTNKKLSRVEDNSSGVGGDGVHSTVRKYILQDDPSCAPIFSQQYFYVALVPMEEAKKKLPKECFDVYCQYAWMGSGRGMLMHNPCNNGETLQLLAAFTTDEPWDPEKWTSEKSHDEMRKDLSSWGKTGEGFTELYEVQSTLLVRSIWEHPHAPTYNSSHACIIGDAAHAMQPWQAGGAGQAIEDSMILQTLLGAIKDVPEIPSALDTYTKMQKERTQYVQTMSGGMGEILMGKGDADPDLEELRKIVPRRWDEMWYFDLDKHQEEALKVMKASIKST